MYCHGPINLFASSNQAYIKKVVLYVCLYVCFISVEEVNLKLEQQLDNAMTWLRNHKLTLNLKKTQIMYFGTQHKLNQIDAESLVTEHGRVDIVKRFKYLGVTLDSKLSFSDHVTYLIKKIVPKLKTLGRIRCHIETNTAMYLYNSCIRNCLKSHRLTPRIDLYSQSGILPLFAQRRIHTCSLLHRGLNEISTSYINNMFNLVSNRGGMVRRLEIRGDVETPRYRLEVTKGNVAYRGPKYYNNLDRDSRGIESKRAFTRKLYQNAKDTMGIG